MPSIKQKSVVVEVDADAEGKGGRRFIVHRMPWSFQRRFLKAFAQIVQGIIAARKSDEQTIRQLLFERLAEVVQQSDELITILCTGSTGLSLDELDALDSLVAAEILRLSLEINFDEDLKNSFAGIVGALAALMPAEPKTTSSGTSTPT